MSRQSVSWLIGLSISPLVRWSVGQLVSPTVGPLVADYKAHTTYGNRPFFFFNRSGKVIDDYVDKNLGHNDGIDNDDDDDDDDGDALADFKR